MISNIYYRYYIEFHLYYITFFVGLLKVFIKTYLRSVLIYMLLFIITRVCVVYRHDFHIQGRLRRPPSTHFRDT